MSGSNPSRDRGTKVETKVLRYLRDALGQPGIDRQPLRGSRDQGDLSGLVAHGFDVVVEVKAHKTVTPSLVSEWRRQTVAERERAGADAAVLVVWRRNHGAADAVAHVTLRDLARVAPVLSVADGLAGEADGSWACMALSELCALVDD